MSEPCPLQGGCKDRRCKLEHPETWDPPLDYKFKLPN
ncbi:hypothetical protein KIPB_016452, partial [Kipferlia bialata]|eukprot:g16452.t1